jgi:hypothetical protein
VADPTANTTAIQAKLADDDAEQTVCLDGIFVINAAIDFVGTKHIKGVGASSSISHALGTVFETDVYYSTNVITIENLTIKETGGYAVVAHEVVVDDVTFSQNNQASILGYSVTANNSTFIGNDSGDSDGGSAIVAEVDVVVNGSTFTGNSGGTILSGGTVDVTDSTFTGNSGGTILSGGTVDVTGSTFSDNISELGGAIQSIAFGDSVVTISNSAFTGNMAGNGGAIYADGVHVENSTFISNLAMGVSPSPSGFGGSIYSRLVQVANSTFVENFADGPSAEGGAIYATEGSVYFTTFVNNLASTPPEEPGDTPGNAIYKTGMSQFNLGGNVFAGDSEFPQLGYGAIGTPEFTDNGGNVFSTSDATETDIIQDPSSVFEASLTALFGTETPSLATHAPNTNGTQTIALVAGNPAIGIVPSGSPFSGFTFDQRGATRKHPADAGAFQFAVAATIGGPTGGAYVPPADFTVLTFPTGVTTPGTDVKVSGLKLKLVKAVYVNGVKVKIQTQRPRSITFATPRGLTGLVDVRFVSAKGEYTAIKALDFGPSVVAGANAQTVVGGFAALSPYAPVGKIPKLMTVPST